MSQLSFLLDTAPGGETSGDAVSIRGDSVHVATPEGVRGQMRLAELLDIVARRQDPLRDVCWPEGVRHVFLEWPMAVVVLELPATVRRVKWVSKRSPVPYGRQCVYDLRTISLPYIEIFATFAWHENPCADAESGGLRLTQRCETFFCPHPLRSLDDQVLLPALLNASKYRSANGSFAVPTKNIAWLCNQHMPISPYDGYPTNDRMRRSLAALADYLLHTGFNYSGGETNPVAAAGGEECSWYEYQVRQKVDKRIASIERWEKESARDPLFILDVPFLPSGFSVRGIAERILREFNARVPMVTCADDLARLVLNQRSGLSTRIMYPHSMWPTPT